MQTVKTHTKTGVAEHSTQHHAHVNFSTVARCAIIKHKIPTIDENTIILIKNTRHHAGPFTQNQHDKKYHIHQYNRHQYVQKT